MKKTSLPLLALGIAVSLTACSKTEKPTQTTNASVAASTVVTTAPASVAASTTTSAPTTVMASTVVVTPASGSATTLNANPAAPAPNAPIATTTPAAGTANLALKADLTLLLKTLNQLDRNAAAKQAQMAKQMQSAKTPADQQAFFKAVVEQLDAQKVTLNKLKFNDPRVTSVRDKMVESINYSRSGTQALTKNPTATPETHPAIAKDMEASQKAAEQARDMLMKLTDEAGIKPQGQQNGKAK
jgi:hypothetical protein